MLLDFLLSYTYLKNTHPYYIIILFGEKPLTTTSKLDIYVHRTLWVLIHRGLKLIISVSSSNMLSYIILYSRSLIHTVCFSTKYGSNPQIQMCSPHRTSKNKFILRILFLLNL